MRPSDIRLVIFDLDGTLVNAYAAITASFNAVMRAHGYPAQPAAVIRRAVGKGDRMLLKPFVGAGDLDRMLSWYRRHHARALRSKARLLPGAGATLATLKRQGYLLAIASNRPTRFSRILVRHLGIAPYFKAILCADKLKRGKPHPAILQQLMRRLKADTGSTVFVGDMQIDAETAHRAGVRAILVTTGSHTRSELAACKPWRLISSLRRLSVILRA